MYRILQVSVFLAIVVPFFNVDLLFGQVDTQVKVVDHKRNPIGDAEGMFYDFRKGMSVSVVNGVVELPSSKGILVIRKQGFKTRGCAIDGKSNEIVLLPTSEPAQAPKTNPLPFDESLTRDLLKIITTNTWESVRLETEVSPTSIFEFKILANVDPVEFENYLELRSLDLETRNVAMSELAARYAPIDMAASLEFIEEIEDPILKSITICQILKHLKSHESSRKLENLLIVISKSIAQPAYRLTSWAVLAEHYFHTGRPELCQQIVDQHLQAAMQLPTGGWAGFPKSLFAALSANQNPDQSLSMLEGMDRGLTHSRALCRVAYFCCDKHPDKAIEMMKTSGILEGGITETNYLIRVCTRMARLHPAKAVSLARLISEPNQRSWALGLIAKISDENNKQFAQSTFKEAIGILRTSRENDASVMNRGYTIGGLLPIAEKVIPEMLDELMWETIFAATSTVQSEKNLISTTAAVETAAANIARYDRDLAISLVPGFHISSHNLDLERSALNQVVLSPENLIAYFEQLEESGPIAEKAKQESVAALLSEKSTFWNAVSKPSLLEWDSVYFEE